MDLAAGPDGKLWVADAGANTVMRVDPVSGVVELITTFPAIPGVFPNPNRGGEMLTDPVPTGIAFDDEGNAYVSLLSGAPFVPGSASVVKVTPAGAAFRFCHQPDNADGYSSRPETANSMRYSLPSLPIKAQRPTVVQLSRLVKATLRCLWWKGFPSQLRLTLTPMAMPISPSMARAHLVPARL